MSNIYQFAAATPSLKVGNPDFNAKKILDLFNKAFKEKVALVVFPELSLTGASCGDLFFQQILADEALKGLQQIIMATARHSNILVVGLPISVRNRLYNASVVLQKGTIYAAIVKTAFANSSSFHEKRYFCSDVSENATVEILGQTVPVLTQATFRVPGTTATEKGFSFGIEIGSEGQGLFAPAHVLVENGAQVICNPSAECAIAGKLKKKENQIVALSAQYTGAYIHAGAGVDESTSAGVFTGQSIIAVDGDILAKNTPLCRKPSLEIAAVSLARLDYERRHNGDCNQSAPNDDVPEILLDAVPEATDYSTFGLKKFPFIPEDAQECKQYCKEIFQMQGVGLARRMEISHSKKLVLGISGGLDSTLTFLACIKCCDLLGLPHDTVCAITMPGAGTTDRTLKNACELIQKMGAELRTISIVTAVKSHFADISHDPENHNVVYENAQARERTQILMDVANEMQGIVIGTSDLSEVALGWSTYNGDHMAMYEVNSTVPKTLMRSIVRLYAKEQPKELADILLDVVDTPVSPELLPGAQHTEKLLGRYMLHDFFLYYFIYYGETPSELFKFAKYVFADECTEEQIKKALRLFVERFFTQQFKKNCTPDGIKTTDISLAPSEWQMPSDVDCEAWLKNSDQ